MGGIGSTCGGTLKRTAPYFFTHCIFTSVNFNLWKGDICCFFCLWSQFSDYRMGPKHWNSFLINDQLIFIRGYLIWWIWVSDVKFHRKFKWIAETTWRNFFHPWFWSPILGSLKNYVEKIPALPKLMNFLQWNSRVSIGCYAFHPVMMSSGGNEFAT